MHYHRKEKEKQKSTDPKSKNQQSTGSMGFPETKFTWHQAKNWPCLVDKKPCQANAKSEVLTPCVQSDNWNCAICRVIVVSVLLPMLRGSRQLESLAGQQLIACTGETFPADLTIAANHLKHLLGPNFNFTTLWADGHQTFQLLPA